MTAAYAAGKTWVSGKGSKQGKSNLYRPLVKKEDYTGLVGKTMLDKMFQGSLANFAAALYQGKKLEEKEIEELQAFIDRQK